MAYNPKKEYQDQNRRSWISADRLHRPNNYFKRHDYGYSSRVPKLLGGKVIFGKKEKA